MRDINYGLLFRLLFRLFQGQVEHHFKTAVGLVSYGVIGVSENSDCFFLEHVVSAHLNNECTTRTDLHLQC